MALLNKKVVLRKARIYSNIFRLVDDLCTLNNDEFENNYNKIYSDELELNKKSADLCKASYLNLSIEVHDEEFTTGFLNERHVFNFLSITCPVCIALYHRIYFMS